FWIRLRGRPQSVRCARRDTVRTDSGERLQRSSQHERETLAQNVLQVAGGERNLRLPARPPHAVAEAATKEASQRPDCRAAGLWLSRETLSSLPGTEAVHPQPQERTNHHPAKRRRVTRGTPASDGEC